MSIMIPPRVALRAASNRTEDDNGCLISLYSTASHGYAQIGWTDEDGKRRATTAHRAAWVHESQAQIPDGMTIDHLCRQRRCVNAAHMRLLSNYENARRTSGRDWPLGVCIKGHDNAELRQYGTRIRCRLCYRHKD